ncbi:MAG: glycosyltransferase family 4 protein [Rhodocyclaceae bacterium]|nr:glycosyltransferase family 4 protein [Rhodocyclaceae bacterium]
MAIFPSLAFLLCVALLSWLLRTGRAHALALDEPNHRSLHTAPTPRIGGLGILAGVLLAMVGVGEIMLASLMLGLALVSWLDDRGHVSVPVRFGVQFTAAVVWVGCFDLNLWSAAVLISLVWMTNLYNFMDGSDGLAAGMAVFGFGAYSVAAWLGGDMAMTLLCAAIAAAALGFLRFNFPPARLFMGDVGSVPLGFAAGALGYQGWSLSLWPWWFALFVFSPFAVDATLTLLRRAFRRERVWQAHREHYYQRLVQMGWGHRKTALAEYGLMLLVALSALALARMSLTAQLAGLSCWGGMYALLAWRIDRAWLASGQR